eukprot:1161325-Pelagomonas_calceolata.AAC.21
MLITSIQCRPVLEEWIEKFVCASNYNKHIQYIKHRSRPSAEWIEKCVFNSKWNMEMRLQFKMER